MAPRTATFSARTTPNRVDLIEKYRSHFDVSKTEFFERAADHELERYAVERFTTLADYLIDRYGVDAQVTVGGGVIRVGNREKMYPLPGGQLVDPDTRTIYFNYVLRELESIVVDALRERTVLQTILVIDGQPGPTGGLPAAVVHQREPDTVLRDAIPIKARSLPKRVVLADTSGMPLDPSSI